MERSDDRCTTELEQYRSDCRVLCQSPYPGRSLTASSRLVNLVDAPAIRIIRHGFIPLPYSANPDNYPPEVTPTPSELLPASPLLRARVQRWDRGSHDEEKGPRVG